MFGRITVLMLSFLPFSAGPRERVEGRAERQTLGCGGRAADDPRDVRCLPATQSHEGNYTSKTTVTFMFL